MQRADAVSSQAADLGAAALVAWTEQHSEKYSPTASQTFEATFAHGLRILQFAAGLASCRLRVAARLQNDYGLLGGAANGGLQAIAVDAALRSTGGLLTAPCSFHLLFVRGVPVGREVDFKAEIEPSKSFYCSGQQWVVLLFNVWFKLDLKAPRRGADSPPQG